MSKFLYTAAIPLYRTGHFFKKPKDGGIPKTALENAVENAVKNATLKMGETSKRATSKRGRPVN